MRWWCSALFLLGVARGAGATEPGPAGTSSTAVAIPPLETTAPDRPAATAPAQPDLRYYVGLEYRAQGIHMDPLSLNDLSAPRVAYIDQRLRLTGALSWRGLVRVHAMFDALDGVLYGDNGNIAGNPTRNKGSIIAAKAPNLARFEVDRLDPEVSSLDPDNYGLVLKPADLLTVRHLYGDVMLPFGLVRAGRQPLGMGKMPLVHDGSRINRWGVSKLPDAVDAFMFATKLSEIPRVLSGEPIDKSQDRGLFLAILFGKPVGGHPVLTDDLTQWAGTAFYLNPDVDPFGLGTTFFKAGVVSAHRFESVFDGNVTSAMPYVFYDSKWLRFGFAHVQMFGGTREVSENLALLSESAGPPVVQDIRAFGGFGEVAVKLWPVELSFEVYYASGDDDPNMAQPLTQITLAPDLNVGLHLFENVLAYQSARSARRGVTNLAALDPPSLAVDEVDTLGGLNNAVALFPQILAFPFEWLSLRAGVLFAFAQKKVVDPVGSTLAQDGATNADDLVNWNGGKPGTYWGTEIDFGLTLAPVKGFTFDFETAYLIPGDALYDEHGQAVNSFFAAIRLTYTVDAGDAYR